MHTDLTTVYVMLVDEGVDVWRPVPATSLGDGRYLLLAPDDYDLDDESWEFPSGVTVECESQMLSDGFVLVALRAV